MRDTSFADTLIQWYRQHQRDLPWRHTRDPYPVWLSEVILQQTRVDQGMAYYHRFLEAFPTIQHLANATEEEVLRLWQGLGYYSRARNLHGTAKAVVGLGEFPRTYEGLLALKGIGPYTAAAIASFCYQLSHPVVDGNVIRVLSRLFAIEEAPDSKEGRLAVLETAHELIHHGHPDLFNQAIMEFGAIQCTPKNPKCDRCPFQSICRAYALQEVEQFPRPKKKQQMKDLSMCFGVVDVEGEWAFVQRTESGIWKGLYEFPSIALEGIIPTEDLIRGWFEQWDLKASEFEITRVTDPIKHVLSHRRIQAVFVVMRPSLDVKIPSTWRLSEWSAKSFGVSRLVEKGWELLQQTP